MLHQLFVYKLTDVDKNQKNNLEEPQGSWTRMITNDSAGLLHPTSIPHSD